MNFSLIVPAFIAGTLTFLAPCTLPLVPGYLGFISGISANDLKTPNKRTRLKIFLNGVFYVIGFSAVFILLGTAFSIGGIALGRYKTLLSQIGGVFVMFFGLYLTGIFSLPFFRSVPILGILSNEKQLSFGSAVKPGRPLSSLIFGATFAFGWTPCVGPILGSVLLLASATSTIGQGILLLAVFSLGLAVPFLLVALGIGSASRYLAKISKYLTVVSIIGGVFLMILGYVLFTNNFSAWISYFYQKLNFIHYDKLLNYL